MQRFSLIIATALLASCATGPDQSQSSNTIVTTIDQYQKQSEAGLDKFSLFDQTNENPGAYIYQGLQAYQRQWCNKDTDAIAKASALAKAHCETLDGEFSKGWCKDDEDQPLFIAKIDTPQALGFQKPNTTEICNGTTAIAVTAITNEQAINPDSWAEVLKQVNIAVKGKYYKNPLAFTQARAMMADDKTAQTQFRLTSEDAKKTGDKVCTPKNRIAIVTSIDEKTILVNQIQQVQDKPDYYFFYESQSTAPLQTTTANPDSEQAYYNKWAACDFAVPASAETVEK